MALLSDPYAWYAKERTTVSLSAEVIVQQRSTLHIGMIIVSILVFVAILGAVMIAPTLGAALARVPSGAVASSTLTPTDSPTLIKARAILARVRDEVIPAEGLGTDYGVSFTDAGYETLRQWNEDYKVQGSYAGGFESLDLRLPCCDWSKPSRDEQSNCACGHHQALEGLSKKLLSEERSASAVQREVTRWAHYLYPKEALSAEMEKRAQLDPDIKTALEELKARGEC